MSITEPNRESLERKFCEVFKKDISDEAELEKLTALAVDGELVASLIEPVIVRVHEMSKPSNLLRTAEGAAARNMAWALMTRALQESIEYLESTVARQISAAMSQARKKKSGA